MKMRFTCCKCAKENEFETDGAIMDLMEEVQVDPYDIYIVKCQSCGTENRVKVKRQSK